MGRRRQNQLSVTTLQLHRSVFISPVYYFTVPTSLFNAFYCLSSLQSVSCTSNEWHPDIINQDGCSNSLDFPEEWRGIPRYFYSNSKECCDFFFPKGRCTVHQVCEDGPSPLSSTEPSLKPTPFPTKLVSWSFNGRIICCHAWTSWISAAPPTRKPTNEPSTQRPTASSTTRRPSALPTPAPVKSPTRVPTKQYYSIPSSGMCKHVDESTPAWITTFFSDYSDCCKSGWAIEACLAEAPSDEKQTVPTTNPTVPPILYYLISSTGICAPVDAYTPSWMTSADFFSDCRECCKSSWNNEACIAAKPCGTPTFTPTSEAMSQPTRTPTIEPVSTQQMTHNPTSRPAALCHSALWHPSEDFSKCTNRWGKIISVGPNVITEVLLMIPILNSFTYKCEKSIFLSHG